MNLVTLTTRFYASLYQSPLPNVLAGLLRILTRKFAKLVLPLYMRSFTPKVTNRKKGLIVSFTSFPARIDIVWQVVKSLKNQTIAPEKIILWLSKEQFKEKSSIPESLWAEVDDIFEIRLVNDDLRSHKKYYYALKYFPDKTFITCDDDVIYDDRMIARLIEGAQRNPKCIVANHSWKIQFSKDGDALHYDMWGGVGDPYSKQNLMQVGVGGVLYPPHCLHKLATKKDIFMKVIPLADDIWLNCMARLNNTPVSQSSGYTMPLPIESDAPNLCDLNNGNGRNELQLQDLRTYLRNKGLNDVYKI